MPTVKFSRLYFMIIALVVLILTSLACAESTPTDEPTISTATPEQQEIVETELTEGETIEEPAEQPADIPTELPPDTPEPEPQFLGDVTEEFGYLLSAVNVEDPATPGMFYTPESGKKLVAVEIIVGVSSGDPLSVNPLNTVLLDSEGFSYQPELGGVDNQLATVDISPGEKVKGWVSFSIPEEAMPSSIKYSIDFFGDAEIKVNLEQPPEGHEANTNALSLVPSEPESKLGDTYEQFGYSLTAMGVEDPAPPGMLYDSRTGHKLVAVDIIISNESGESLSVNPLKSVLVDSNGYVYLTELGGRDEQMATLDISSGEKVRGWVSFTIPEESSPYIVKYLVDMFTSNYLMTGLVE